MVRETRYLLVGNLPENTTENEITEYFKRFGRIQKVKIERKQEEKEEKEDESQTSTLTATVAFTDIKSASNAHKADKKLLNNTLTSEYSEGFGATGSVVTRSHEPDHFPRAAGFPANRKGFEEEADGFDVYYGTTSPFNESPYSGSSPFSDRGRPRERWPAGSTFPGRGAKWTPGTPRVYPSDGSSKDGFEKPKTSSSIPASSPTHSTSQSSEKHGKKKKKSKSVDRSRSSSGSSRSSSSSSESCSASSSKERPKSTISAAVQPRLETQDSAPVKETDIEPGEREPLGIYITKLPLRSSDTSLRDGLFHEYKKYGKITAVQVSGVADTRFAIVSFKQAEDAAKALEASKDKRFFGTNIVVVAHEGLEVDDPEYGTPEQQLDEHSPKATRTLFLGNLEKDITIEELKEKLEKYGEILDVDVKRQGAISAYAFIQFTDITSVVRALRDLDGTTWGPSKLKVGFGKSMATSVIWLDNLAETVNEGFLYRQFGRFGGISHTVVDRVKRKGLVFFLNIESAQYALPEMRNRIWNGKKIHIDFASRDCQDSFFLKMEQTNQLRPGERPDQRWMQKQMQSEPFWDESVDAINTARRGSFTQVARGRGRFQRGRGVFRGRGTGSFEIGFSSGDEFTAGRRRQLDEFSQGSGGQYMDDDYEQELRDYGHSQRERRERSSQSPPGYEDIYYEAGSQSGREFDVYEKHRYTTYRSLSPGSDREMDTVEDEYKYKTRTPSDDRYYYKDKFYEESKSRDRSHSSDSETRFRLSSEIVRRSSRSRSPTLKHKRTKELPFSYRSQSPPTPTDDEPSYYLDSGSPTDFESAYRKYDYKKRLSSSAEGDKKSEIFSRTGLRKEIEAKSEERTSRKRSYDQLSPSRSDSVMRLERQHSRGSKSGSVFDYNDKQSAKELISKVNRLKSEVHERTFGKDSPSSGSSYGDVDTSNMSEAELAKLHREKQKLLDKLTQLDDTGHNSDSENLDTRRVVSKKARLDVSQSGLNKYLHKSDSLTKQEIKEKLKMLDSAQSSRKHLEALRKKELLREFKKSKSSDAKKDLLDYSDDEHLSVNSPHDLSGFMPKKRRKVEGESDRKSRSYRIRRDDEQGYSSDDEKDRRDLLQKQISAHSDLLSKSRSGSMDTHLENDLLYSHSKDDSRRTSSGSDNNKDSGHSRRHRRKKDDHITPLIPLGDDDMPDPETSDPRGLCEKSNSPMVLPLPEFAQFIQFSPLPSPHRSPEYPDLPTKSSQDREADVATGAADTGNTEQSPCFSPQSSSSKTHSPSQSPSGSGSDSKANTNSDSGELPPGFPTETEHPEVSDENKPDSLDSLPDPTKLPTETKEDNDSFSDNNSDIENLSSENLSIDERIRRLDEKWSKAQAVVAATSHKVIPDVESVVNPSTSNVLGSYSATPTTTMPLTVSSPNVSSIYSKYRIRKKNDPASSGGEKAEPSEIVQTVLSKSSIFDQDSRRLGQYGDSYDSKDNISCEENVSPLPSVWSKLDNDKDSPMVTVPGSLMDRLGQTQNVSFPTLNVTTSLTNSILSSNKDMDSLNKSGLNLSDSFTPKSILSNSYDSHSASIDSKFEANKPPLEQNSILLNSDTSSVSQTELNDKISPCIESLEKSPNFTESDKNTDSRAELTNSIDVSSKVEATQSNKTSDKEMNNSSAFSELPSKSDIVESNGIEELGNPMETSVELSNSMPEANNVGEKCKTDTEKLNDTVNNLKTESANKSENDTMMQTSNDVHVKVENESGKKDPVKKESRKEEKNEGVSVKESRTAYDVDLFGMEAPIVLGKRKLEDTKSEKGSEKNASTSVKKETKKDTDSNVVKDVSKTDQKPSVSEKSKSDRDKHSSKDSSKGEKSDSSKEPSSKKQKISKDKKTESSHKDDKKKNEKKETSHKSTSDKKDDKKDKEKDKHKSKTEKTDKKSSKEKDSKEEKKEKDSKEEKKEKDSKDEKKKKSEKKEKESKKEDKKEDKKEKHEEKKEKSDEKKDKIDKKETVDDKKVALEEKKEKVEEKKTDEKKTDEKKDKHEEKKEKVEKKEKEKSEKKEKEKHEKKDSHKHKSPEKRSKSASKDDENKETPKENPVKDEKSEKKKEHKSSSSHKSKKVKEETSSKKSKDDHGEHKKKDESSNRNNKDSPDKSKEGNRKEPGTEKKDSNSDKGKEKESGEKCNDQKTKEKEKENKDKDPDVPKSKSKANSSESSSKISHSSFDSHPEKNKSGDRSGEDKKGEDKKEEKKNKESSSSKSSSQKSNSRDKSKDSQKKSSKSEKQSEKSTKSSDSKQETKDKSSEKDSKQERKETPKKCAENGLTEEDLAIFAQFSDEPYLSMYDKVKRRSTDKKMKIERETEEQKKLLSEYKRGAKKKDGKKSLSDITESSDMSTDDEKFKKKTNPKAKKKFGFSSDDSDSASDSDILKKKPKSKTVTKKPKRILDIYSSDSEEEEERMSKTPAKTPTSGNKSKKNEVVKENEHHNFNFDSLSDSDHKTTSTRPAKPKTISKSTKKTSKSKESKTPAKTNGPDQKKNISNFKPTKKKNISIKNLFSDDSDDSMLSDSDSDSDISGIMLSPKAKKKVDQKNDKDKKKLPKGSSIYTTSEDSLSDDDTRPPTPITSGNGGKSDGFTSDPDLYHKEPPKTKDVAKKNKKNIDSSFITGIDSIKNKYSSDLSDSRLLDKIEKDLEKDLFSTKKAKKQRSKDKSHKDDKKILNNKKLSESLTDDLNIIMANSKLDINDVYSETVFEKDNNKLFSNLTNKDNVQQIVSEHEIDQALKYQSDSVKKDIMPIQEDVKAVKPQKNKNKKHKKENKKKKKSKDKDDKDSLKDTQVDTLENNFSDLKTENELVQDDDKLEKSENIKPDTDPDTTATLNAVTRNLFEEIKEIKSTGSEDKKKKKKKKDAHPAKEHQSKNETKKFEPKVERLSDSDFFSDSDKKKDSKSLDTGSEEKSEKVSTEKSNKKIDPNDDIFDFNEEEDSSFRKIKESHMKIIKPDLYDIKLSNDDDDEQDTSNVPVEIQGVEIEYQSEDHEIKEENICPVVEPSEVVIEQTTEEKIEKSKPKPRKRKGRKGSGRENDNSSVPDLTVEAVSSLEKEHKQAEDIQTEVVHFDAPVSNEQELVIDEGVSLHVEDEASKAVESIVTDENVIDETAKAVESILFGDEMASFTISEPVEPTPQLDQDYLQPEFAPGLPSGIPQIGNEVETTTASPVAKGRKGRKGRRSKSGQGDLFANESSNVDSTDITPSKQSSGNKFDYFDDTSYASDISNLHDQNDDDDDGRLQIDFDPPKPEPKQKKQRKPRTPKTKLADAAALAAENKMPNLFGNFHPEPEQNKDNTDGNRDSLSSENSELENAKHDDLLYMNREDQRHDSDMMSPDERSASEDTADGSKVKRRGRKPKNKDVNSMPIPRTNSPRSTRTTSPRSPRNADPRSPKFESAETKLTAVKLAEETLDNKAGKLSSNVFDFDETDETTTTAQPATTKQRKPRRKKGEPMQSPDNRGIFSSPDRKSLDKLSISSPEPKLPFGSPEHNSQQNLGEKKMGLFSPSIQPEEPKLEVQNASVEEKGPPEPLFKAFFEGKTKENQKVNPLLAKKGAGKDKEEGKLTSPLTSHSQLMSNVDKTIDDVSKGKFESTDDENKEESPVQGQKKRQLKKGKEEEAKLGMVKSPLKSPLPNHLNSPPPSTSSQPLVLPGMGLHSSPMSPQGLISKPGQTPLSPGMTNKVTPLQTPLSPAASGAKFDPLQKMGIQSPKPALQSPKANQLSPKGLQSPKSANVPQSPFRSQPLLSPTKTSTISTSGITTVVSTGPVVTTSPSSAVQDLRKADISPEGAPKLPMPGFMVPGISTASGISVGKSGVVSSVISSTTVVPSTVVDGQKKQQEIVAEQLQKQQLEQQRLAELELQRQQAHHIRLKEEELKQKREFQKQHLLAEQQAKLQQEQREEKLIEQKKLLEGQQKKKMLQEHHKMLQQQYEELQRKQAMQAAAVVSSGNQLPPGLLSPGALPVPRPSLPSPNEGQVGQRPPNSVLQQSPPFGLPGQHPGGLPVRPATIPPHFAQQMAMRQLVPPLDKPPTSAELELTHQQLQQHIAAQQAQQKAHAQAQQKAQAQALAEQQAQMAKHEAQQAQAQAKQIAQGKAGPPVLQQAQGKQTAAQQKKATEAAKNAGQPTANNRKDLLLQRPPGHSVGVGILSPGPGKDAPAPGSQEAANQLTQQIRQQLAMSQANQQTGQTPQQHPIHGWPLHGIRPDGPRQPGPMPVTSEARISMPGPVPVLGGNPQQVQRVSPHPPTKSPTVAQTAPNMVHGFSQNQAATPRAPSPAVAKTAERQASGSGKWNGSPGSQRPGQPDVRPRVPSSDAGAVRPEMWAGMNGPTNPATHAMPGAPRPAHQQPPSAHRQQPDHLHLSQGHGEMSTKDKFIHQQKQIQEFQRQQELMHQEMQRQHLREQALQAKAQKEVQLHKERERAESLEREKRERDSRAGLTAQSPSDPHHNPAIARMGYPFAEPRPPSRDGKMPPQSPAIDPRDPRFTQQFPGHHATDLRLGSTTSSAFSPASGTADPHLLTTAELQRFQQNGMIPAGYGLRMLEPHLIGGPTHGPYMIPGLPLPPYMAAQQMDQAHLIDGRPPSRGGSARPPSTQSIHTLSPTQAPGADGRNQNRPGQAGQVAQTRDPHPGDGSLLNLLQRYPVMWQGVLGLKNDQCVVQMHFISGCQPLVKSSLPQQGPDGTVQPLRIAQRMRLEQTQLEGVAKRMQMEKDYCMMLALPCGRDTSDIYQQTKAMSTGFIQYLQQKQAAGIVNVADPGSQQPAYVVHIFPPCDFSQTTLSRLGFDLLYQVKDLAHLIVIIATVA